MEKHFDVRDEGTVILLVPLTDVAKRWLEDNVAAEPWSWLGENLVVDHRYADDILQGFNEYLNGWGA